MRGIKQRWFLFTEYVKSRIFKAKKAYGEFKEVVEWVLRGGLKTGIEVAWRRRHCNHALKETWIDSTKGKTTIDCVRCGKREVK